MQSQGQVIFCDGPILFPPVGADSDADERTPDAPAPAAAAAAAAASAFAVAVNIRVTMFARCATISVCDATREEVDEAATAATTADGASASAAPPPYRTAPRSPTQVTVNACAVPALGACVAVVPRPGHNDTSSTTLLDSGSGLGASRAGGAGAGSSATDGAQQECIARAVAERLVLRANRPRRDNEQASSAFGQKLVVCHCGLGAGAGVAPGRGAEFLRAALESPMLIAAIVGACERVATAI
jgi:hypothetical protein